MTSAIILSGGVGSRVKHKDVPKQYIEVSGHPIIWYVLDTVIRCRLVDQCMVVAAGSWRDLIRKQYEDIAADAGRKQIGLFFANPGENRQLSILSGLEQIERMENLADVRGRWENPKSRKMGEDLGYEESAVRQTGDHFVVIVDAARPKMSSGLLVSCIEAAKACDGAIPVLPMKDTIYFSENGSRISGLLERRKLFAGQAPEAFKFCKYLEANRRLLPDRIKSIVGSTEPAILADMEIRMIEGDEENYKITTDEDLKRFREEGQGQ